MRGSFPFSSRRSSVRESGANCGLGELDLALCGAPAGPGRHGLLDARQLVHFRVEVEAGPACEQRPEPAEELLHRGTGAQMREQTAGGSAVSTPENCGQLGRVLRSQPALDLRRKRGAERK